jgi:dTDP-4-dehydrorhamnose reductase
MRPRILLTGKNGQIGQELERLLPNVGDVVALDRGQLDLSKPAEIRRKIQEIRPHLIVNAAAYTAVDQAESDTAAAQAMNADAPAVIAQEAKKIGAGMVHYSTDYVFDGLSSSPYKESDQPNPKSVYGRTKLAGEEAVRDAGIPHLIFRTAWVYATRGRNFLLTILRLASEREELRIVNDQFGSPTWCHEIAGATVSILGRQAQNEGEIVRLTDISGTYHVTASGITTWFGFAEAILTEAHKAPTELRWLTTVTNGNPLLTHLAPITSREYPTAARRPPYSVLSNALVASTFGVQLPDWRRQLHSAFGNSHK